MTSSFNAVILESNDLYHFYFLTNCINSMFIDQSLRVQIKGQKEIR